MKIGASLLADVVAHAQRDAPNECCGVLAMRDGAVEEVVALENLQASPLRFEIGAELVHVFERIEDTGATLGAIYHSHTRSAPYPSPTDINFAVGWPGVEWLIVSTDGPQPEARSYLITAEGDVSEVRVEIIESG